jgi:hypothetical protein
MKCAGWIVLLMPALAAAAEQPQDFAYGTPVQFEGHEALYEANIPASVYRGVTRRDLGDLRVFNGKGELVPFAVEPPSERRTQSSAAHTVRFFPIYASANQSLDGVELKVEKASGATVVSVVPANQKASGKRRLVAYLIDASAINQPYQLLQLDWRQKTASFAINVRLDASDDLKNWEAINTRAPLMRLDYEGERLEQRAIEFAPRRSKYLRLSVAEMHGAQIAETDTQLELSAASLRGADIAVEAARNWMELNAAAGDSPGEYRFDLGGPYPVDRVRTGLVQDNTIATVDLLVRATMSEPWHSIAHSVVYRLTREGHQVMSPELSVGLHSERFWLLRVDQRGGGLGTSMPILYAGWVPQKIVFAARGEAPFQIAYGSARALPAGYPIETLVPGWRNDARPKLPQAQTLPEHLLGGAASLQRQYDRKTWGLWTALVLGVAVLGWMAWRLAKQMQSPAPATPARGATQHG